MRYIWVTNQGESCLYNEDGNMCFMERAGA